MVTDQGMIWLMLSVVIFGTIRFWQYGKESGWRAVGLSCLLDMFAIGNPYYSITVATAIVIKQPIFKFYGYKTGIGYPYVDLLMYVVALSLYSTVENLYGKLL